MVCQSRHRDVPRPSSLHRSNNDSSREQGQNFETHLARTGSWYSSARIGEEYSAYKVLLEKGSGRILGAHILGPNAEELINLFTIAMAGGLHSEDIQGMIFGYPTYASDISYMF